MNFKIEIFKLKEGTQVHKVEIAKDAKKNMRAENNK